MFKSGWVRLWAVLTFGSLVMVLAYSTYFVWGVDSCYRLMTIATAENLQPQDQRVIDSMREDIGARQFCGTDAFSTPLTLEQLAKRKIVTQIAYEWLEPAGWAFEKRETLDFLAGDQITVERISGNTSTYVRKARISVASIWILGVLLASAALLLLGLGISWVRQGFRP